jgi:hypothetical protein
MPQYRALQGYHFLIRRRASWFGLDYSMVSD